MTTIVMHDRIRLSPRCTFLISSPINCQYIKSSSFITLIWSLKRFPCQLRRPAYASIPPSLAPPVPVRLFSSFCPELDAYNRQFLRSSSNVIDLRTAILALEAAGLHDPNTLVQSYTPYTPCNFRSRFLAHDAQDLSIRRLILTQL